MIIKPAYGDLLEIFLYHWMKIRLLVVPLDNSPLCIADLIGVTESDFTSKTVKRLLLSDVDEMCNIKDLNMSSSRKSGETKWKKAFRYSIDTTYSSKGVKGEAYDLMVALRLRNHPKPYVIFLDAKSKSEIHSRKSNDVDYLKSTVDSWRHFQWIGEVVASIDKKEEKI
jgi:hypothetical protein